MLFHLALRCKTIKAKSLIVFLVLSLLFSGCSIKNEPNKAERNSQYGFWGSGTESDPFIIGSKEDLLHLRDMVNAGESFNSLHFFQAIDIDLSSVENWIPIGKYGTQKYFSGFYNGGGHSISNITCLTDSDNVGLFGMLDGEVRNLGIESGTIRGGCVGSIASHGTENSLILNCYNKAALHGKYRAGGISDHLLGKILFCFNFGDITCDTANGAAGLVSYYCTQLAYSFTSISPATTPFFFGELIKSSTIDILALDEAFLQKRHQAMQSWDSLFMESDRTAEMKVVNGDIRMEEMELGSKTNQAADLQRLILLLVLMLALLVCLDVFINIRPRKAPGKRG